MFSSYHLADLCMFMGHIYKHVHMHANTHMNKH